MKQLKFFLITMVGIGYDIHRLARGHRLKLGGIEIPSDRGTVAHSDGDVLLHALCDALLGAAALGDIGEWFPDTDPQWKGADSATFVEAIIAALQARHLSVAHIDGTIVLQQPKIAPYKQAMRRRIAELCQVPLSAVSIKATTNEQLDSLGNGEAVAAWVVCLLKPASAGNE